jgi:hypothetical protein
MSYAGPARRAAMDLLPFSVASLMILCSGAVIAKSGSDSEGSEPVSVQQIDLASSVGKSVTGAAKQRTRRPARWF